MKLQKLYSKKLWINIREIVWPLLEKSDVQIANGESENEIKPSPISQIHDDHTELAFELCKKMNADEEARRKGTETKAALFINTIIIATSVVVAMNTFVVGTSFQVNKVAAQISIIMSFALTVYAARTVWFAIKALERGRFHVLGSNDICFSDKDKNYKQQIITRLIQINKENTVAINNKIDNMTMAQEYYKRAIITICLYAFLILVQSFL